MENVILIGMPGCGKTVVGRLLAPMLGMKFVDLDHEIERCAGKKIPQIFTEEGEVGFRRKETEMLREVTKKSGQVIASGGGIVTQIENHEVLRAGGRIVFLKRPINQLARKGRPLSGGDLTQMYRIRLPLYENLADFIVESGETPKKTAENIAHILEGKK